MNDNKDTEYNISLVSNKNEIIDSIKKQEEIVDVNIDKFVESHKKEMFNKKGEFVGFAVKTNPLVVLNTFFNSIVPMEIGEPKYDYEKLALIFQYYIYILTKVNDKIINYPSSLTSFCKLAGISIETLRKYKQSDDVNMKSVVEKIYDQINDENLIMSQLGIVKEKTTSYKLKSQNELLEKIQPNINISLKESIDKDEIDDKINKYRNFIDANIVKGEKDGKKTNKK